MYAATIFFFILGMIAVWAFALLLYQKSFFSKTSPNARLPLWERCLYYFIAVYPVLSYIALKPAGDYFEKAGTAEAAVKQQFAIYIFSHIILSIISLAITRYLIRRSKYNIIFAVTTTISSGMYAAGAIVLLMIHQ